MSSIRHIAVLDAELPARLGGEGVTTRREFLGGLAATACAGGGGASHGPRRNITVAATDLVVEREPLVRPFGFKGGYLTELWQSAARLTGASGVSGIGLGTQSVLWSDAAVFASRSETSGNELMLALTRHALSLVRGRSFETPLELLDEVYPDILAYGRRRRRRGDARRLHVFEQPRRLRHFGFSSPSAARSARRRRRR